MAGKIEDEPFHVTAEKLADLFGAPVVEVRDAADLRAALEASMKDGLLGRFAEVVARAEVLLGVIDDGTVYPDRLLDPANDLRKALEAIND